MTRCSTEVLERGKENQIAMLWATLRPSSGAEGTRRSVAAALALVVLQASALMDPQPGDSSSTLHWITQKTDHFNRGAPPGDQLTFQQRYFVYDKFWSSTSNADGSTSRGPIFFYAGNEDYVDLYVNATGLMWENAEAFGALLVFAEHR